MPAVILPASPDCRNPQHCSGRSCDNDCLGDIGVENASSEKALECGEEKKEPRSSAARQTHSNRGTTAGYAELAFVRPTASHDSELIRRVLAGERELFHDLVRPYKRSLYNVTRSILRNDQEAEDVAQETMLKALKNLRSFRAESRFSTWLVAIAVNEARLCLRRDRNAKLLSAGRAADDESAVLSLEVIADSREIPLQTLQRKELRQILWQAIASLPDNYRTVLLLRDVEELSIAETASILDVTESMVKTRLHRERTKMRKILSGSCRSPQARPRAKNESMSELRMWLGRGCEWQRSRTCLPLTDGATLHVEHSSLTSVGNQSTYNFEKSHHE